MRWSDLAVLFILGLPLAAQPIGGGIFGKMPTGTVTSVGLTTSAPLEVSGSPITGSGTMSLSFQNQSANTVLAGPTSGGAAAPGFRALVAGDIPTIAQSQVTNLTTDLAAKVAGAASLTTVGAVPFVASAGTLGQDGSNLFWDNTNKRLGIGTASPAVPLDVVGNFRASGASSIFTGGALTISGTANAVHTIYISDYSAAAADWNYIRADNGKFTITGSLNNAIWLVPGGAGRVIISGNAGIGPSNTAPTGTLSVVDRTAVTGSDLINFCTDGTNTPATTCSVVVRAGQAQGSTALQSWQNNAGTRYASMWATGAVALGFPDAPSSMLHIRHPTDDRFGGIFLTDSTGAYSSTISRAAGSGGGLVLRSQSVDSLTVTGAGISIAGDTLILATAKTPSSAADTCTTGQHAWDASYAYFCTATNTWRRVAHATW